MLTPEERAEIRARADAATGGLWVVVYDGTERSVETTESGRFVCHLNSNMLRYSDDADFIAAARTDVPRLLDALEAAERRATEYLEEAHMMSVRCDRHTEEQADVEDRLTAERDAARRWSAAWKAVATRKRKALHHTGGRLAMFRGRAVDAERRAYELREALRRLTSAFEAHRTATHKVEPKACRTCQDSNLALAEARAALAGEGAP